MSRTGRPPTLDGGMCDLPNLWRPPKKRKKRKARREQKYRQGGRVKDATTVTGDPRADTRVRCYCLRCIPDTVLATSRILVTTSGQQSLTRVCRWATHVSEQDLETTEGEGVDFLAELLALAGWSQVNDKETEKDLS